MGTLISPLTLALTLRCHKLKPPCAVLGEFFPLFFGALLLMAVGHYQQNLKTILKTDSLSIELCKKYITKRPN